MTDQALLDDTCAANVAPEDAVGTGASADSESSTTPVGRYGSEHQNATSDVDRSMPMTMSTLPSASAPSGSLPTSTMDSFSPSSSANAAATSTSSPAILLVLSLSTMPDSGGFSASTPTRSVPSCPMAGLATTGLLVSGV